MMLAQGLFKTYKRRIVLESVDWETGNGVYGLIGPSGSGKSTLLKVLSGTLQPRHGDVQIEDISLSSHPDEYRQNVGYLPQDFNVNGDLTIFELMNRISILKGLTHKNTRCHQIEAILAQLGLWESRMRKIKTLPIGMMQRLGVAQALLNEPQLLLLDEPACGLNPLERTSLFQLLCQYGKTHTVIFSSHYALDIIHCCQNVSVIQSGRIIFKGLLKEVAHFAKEQNNRPQNRYSDHENVGLFEKRQLTSAFINGYQQMVRGFLE